MEKIGLEQLRENLIRDIFSGSLPGGSWLKQADLERRYGVSRALVRRVLDDLTVRDYVQHEPNRGYRVAILSDDNRNELREIRVVLECHAAASVMECVTPADVDELATLAEAFRQATQTGTLADQVTANFAFHQRLYEVGRNRTLFDLLMEMHHRAVARVVTPWPSVAQMERAANDHFSMVEALKNGDLAALQETIRRHVGHLGK